MAYTSPVVRVRGKGPDAAGTAVVEGVSRAGTPRGRGGVLEELPPEPPGGKAGAQRRHAERGGDPARPRPRSAGAVGPRRKQSVDGGAARPSTATIAGGAQLSMSHRTSGALPMAPTVAASRPASAASSAGGFFVLTGVAGVEEEQSPPPSSTSAARPLSSRSERPPSRACEAEAPSSARSERAPTPKLDAGRAGAGSLRASRARALVEQEDAAAARRAELMSYMESLRLNDAIELPKELANACNDDNGTAEDHEASPSPASDSDVADEGPPSLAGPSIEPEVEAAIQMMAPAAALGVAPERCSPKVQAEAEAEGQGQRVVAGGSGAVEDEVQPPLASAQAACECSSSADDVLSALTSKQESRRFELRGYMSRLASGAGAVKLGPAFNSSVDDAIAQLEARVMAHAPSDGQDEPPSDDVDDTRSRRASEFLSSLSSFAADVSMRVSATLEGGDRHDDSADAALAPRLSTKEREGIAAVSKLDEQLQAAEAAAQARLRKCVPQEMQERQGVRRADADNKAAEALRLARKRRKRARRLAITLAGVGAGKGDGDDCDVGASEADPKDILRRNALLVKSVFVGSLSQADEELVERILAEADPDGVDDDATDDGSSRVSSVWMSGFATDDTEAARLAAIEARIERFEAAHHIAEGDDSAAALVRPSTAAPTVWSVSTTSAGNDYLERVRAEKEGKDALENVDKQIRSLVTSHIEKATPDQITLLLEEARREQQVEVDAGCAQPECGLGAGAAAAVEPDSLPTDASPSGGAAATSPPAPRIAASVTSVAGKVSAPFALARGTDEGADAAGGGPPSV